MALDRGAGDLDLRGRRGSGVRSARRVGGVGMRHLDLCSGIGGFALAAKMAGGIETVGFCEIDPWAQRVLRKNFPGVPIHGDLRTLEENKYGNVRIISAGYPCQPFSTSGERKGADDDRHLWPEVFRVVSGLRPDWVVCENVIGHVSMGLDAVLSDLERCGYSCGTFIIPACSVGAVHKRERVWIVADSGRGGRPGSGRSSERIYKKEDRGGSPGEFVDVLGWPTESPICRGDDGLSGRMDGARLRGLGNAIVPQIAAEIFRLIVRIENRKEKESDRGGDLAVSVAEWFEAGILKGAAK